MCPNHHDFTEIKVHGQVQYKYTAPYSAGTHGCKIYTGCSSGGALQVVKFPDLSRLEVRTCGTDHSTLTSPPQHRSLSCSNWSSWNPVSESRSSLVKRRDSRIFERHHAYVCMGIRDRNQGSGRRQFRQCFLSKSKAL